MVGIQLFFGLILFILIFQGAIYGILPFVSPPYLQFGIRIQDFSGMAGPLSRVRVLYLIFSASASAIVIIVFIFLWLLFRTHFLILFIPLLMVIQLTVYLASRKRVRLLKLSNPLPEATGGRTEAVFHRSSVRNDFLWMMIPWIELTAFIMAGFLYYPHIPSLLPTHYGLGGRPDQYSRKSFYSVFLLPVFVGIPITVFFTFMSRAIRGARPPYNPSTPRKTAVQITGFNRIISRFISVVNVILIIVFLLISLAEWGIISMAVIPYISFLPVSVIISATIFISLREGQGGWKMYRGLSERPTSGSVSYVDDDSKWLGGLIYHNRDDPSIMVPRRFGVGYSFNYSNHKSLIILILILSLPLTTVAMLALRFF